VVEVEPVQVIMQDNTSSDPKVGEKRPRTEDEMDVQQAVSAQGPSASKQETLPTGPQMSGGVPNGAMQSNSASQMVEDGYDALYIGDLQWVRSDLFGVKHTLMPFSGQRTRICARWLSVSASLLITKTSPSRNTRSTAKAKGMFSQKKSSFLPCVYIYIYAVRIAYVECGSPANAAVVKEWFDSK
jgi:hypothetical protein